MGWAGLCCVNMLTLLFRLCLGTSYVWACRGRQCCEVCICRTSHVLSECLSDVGTDFNSGYALLRCAMLVLLGCIPDAWYVCAATRVAAATRTTSRLLLWSQKQQQQQLEWQQQQQEHQRQEPLVAVVQQLRWCKVACVQAGPAAAAARRLLQGLPVCWSPCGWLDCTPSPCSVL